MGNIKKYINVMNQNKYCDIIKKELSRRNRYETKI